MTSKTEVSVTAILSDFKLFLRLVWSHLGLPPPTPLQLDLADYLQHGGTKRRVIMAFRGVGKSWITVAFVCWLLLRDPNEKILVVSASKNLANNFSTFCKQLIGSMPILAHLKAKDGQRDSMIEFDVGPSNPSKDPSVKSVGITGQITGSRASRIVADDIEVTNNSATTIQREKLGELIKEFDAILKPGGEITYLGTPQTEDSVYNKLPERGYEIRVWPARYPKDPSAYRGRLAPFIQALLDASAVKPGDPTDPKRFSTFDLDEREMSWGRSGFALQFMLDTSLNDQDRYPLKLKDLIVFPIGDDVAPARFQWASGPDQVIDGLPCLGFTGDRYHRPMWTQELYQEFQGSIMYIDPSGMGKDETAFAVVKFLNGNLFAKDVRGLRGGYTPENLTEIAKTAKRHKVSLIRVEENFGQGMFSELLKPYLEKIYNSCTVENIRNTGQKERRIIDVLEPVMNQHRLIVDQELIEKDYQNYNQHDNERYLNYCLFHQMTRVTKERGALAHDDRLEALAGAVMYWVEQMGLDDFKGHQHEMERLIQKEIDDWEDQASAGGSKVVSGVKQAAKRALSLLGERLGSSRV